MFVSASAVLEARGLAQMSGASDKTTRIKPVALMQLDSMRNHLRMVCDTEQGAAAMLDATGDAMMSSSNGTASIAGLSAATRKQLANSRYGDLQLYEKRLGLMRQYVLQWCNLVDTLQRRRDRLKTAVLPQFSWRSGVDGRVYTSTCLAFETVMAGHLLAANLYNVQQRLHEIVTSPGASVSQESVQQLYLVQTAEAYRVLAQVCLENVVKAHRVLDAQALANRTQDACASALGASRPPSVLPPECDSELCVARMSMCLVRMHHHNSKRMLSCVLRRTNRAGLRRESYVSQADQEGQAPERPKKSDPGRGLTWSTSRLESANALDVALGAQWTLRQLTQLKFNLHRAALPPPDQFATGRGAASPAPSATASLVAGVALNMMNAAAAKTKAAAGVPAAGNSVGTSGAQSSKLCTLDACAPRWDATSVEVRAQRVHLARRDAKTF